MPIRKAIPSLRCRQATPSDRRAKPCGTGSWGAWNRDLRTAGQGTHGLAERRCRQSGDSGEEMKIEMVGDNAQKV